MLMVVLPKMAFVKNDIDKGFDNLNRESRQS